MQFDGKTESGDSGISDEDKERTRMVMATLLFGCAPAVSYAYHLKVLLDKKDSTRGISGILVACSESAELHSDLQKSFNDSEFLVLVGFRNMSIYLLY